jgi:pyocin large subunit-like protein
MMRGRHLVATALLAVAVAVALLVMRDAAPAGPVGLPAPASTAPAPATTAPGPVAAATANSSSRGFRTQELFRDHYAKHGREFGNIPADEYLRQAQSLRDAPLSATVLEIRRKDGVVSRFDKATGSFIAFNADGTIRTFFRPTDGENYFRRQATTSH